MNKLLLFIVVLSACSSGPPEKEIKSRLVASFRKYMDDYAFREKKVVKIHELTLVRYSMVDENYVDELRRERAFAMVEHWSSVSNKYFDVVMSAADLVKLSDTQSEYDRRLIDFKKYQKEAEAAGDSLHYWADVDSLIGDRIKARGPVEPQYYLGVFFAKIEMEKENVLDTLDLVFDENLNYIHM